MTQQTSQKIRLLLVVLIVTSFVGCDQATKRMATETLHDRPAQVWLGDSVRLQYALNPGGFLSIGSALSPEVRQCVFVGLNGTLLAAVAVFMVLNRRGSLAAMICAAFLLAGGIGNQIDRVTNDGLVTDFINLGTGTLRTGVFNVADIGITFGAIGLALLSSRREQQHAAYR